MRKIHIWALKREKAKILSAKSTNNATDLKTTTHDACFPAKLLAGLESCHRIGYDASTDSHWLRSANSVE